MPSEPFETPEPPGRTLQARAIGRGALLGLVVIVPVAVISALADRVVDDFESSGWAPLFALAIIVAYLVAGVGAGRVALDAPMANGALAGLGALALWLPLRILIWALRDPSNELFTGTDPVFSASRLLGQAALAAGLGALGAVFAARRIARRPPTWDHGGGGESAGRPRTDSDPSEERPDSTGQGAG